MCMHMYMCMLGECVTGFLTERERLLYSGPRPINSAANHTFESTATLSTSQLKGCELGLTDSRERPAGAARVTGHRPLAADTHLKVPAKTDSAHLQSTDRGVEL